MVSRTAPRRIAVHVVVPPNVLLLDIAGPVEVLRTANVMQRKLRFDVVYVGATTKINSSIGMPMTDIRPLPSDLPDGAIVIVPGATQNTLGTAVSTAAQDRVAEARITAWLRDVVRPGIRVVTICSGALLVARAGLLDGFECTTHHECTEQLAREAPLAQVRENRLYVEDGERLTSAGITAGIDLMLHLLAGFVGVACTVAVARFLVVYLRRAGDDPQLSPWLDGRNHMHPVIHRAQDAVAARPAHDWTLALLATEAKTSPRHLSRLFNRHAGMSVSAYVNRLRLALANELLAGSRLDMETVAERSGFGSARQLRRAWGRLHAAPPSRSRSPE